jgi:hypothetical protein
MSHCFGKIRRFRFNLPQRIAAVLLALFLAQGFWIASRQSMTERDYQYARCGREIWERPATLFSGSTSCGNLSDGILAYRLAGLPLTAEVLLERALDPFRQPENRVVLAGSAPGAPSIPSIWELRHQLPCTLLLLRLPFLLAGCALGGGLWWVTRRLYGNFGGYTALTLYCFSPAMLSACLSPNSEILAALGLYGGIYTSIGVAHAMQGPQRKWRPRIVLLTVVFAIAAGAHLAALALAALLGLAFMLWIAIGRRRPILPVVLAATAGALLLLFACCGFSPLAFGELFRLPTEFPAFSADAARRFFLSPANIATTIAAIAGLALYLASRRSRYFGNTVPLLCALLLFCLILPGVNSTPWLWALPFLFTFIAGLAADAYESPRGKLALAAGAAIVLLQVISCVLDLPKSA